MEKLSKKLNLIFKNKIKFSVVSILSVIIVTKDDKCYEIGRDFFSNKIKNPLITLSDEIKIKSLIEESFVEKLSYENFIDFKNGLSHSIARNSNGYVCCWGSNAYGLLGNGSNNYIDVYKPEYNTFLFNLNVIDMCCGHYHTLVLTMTGDVFAWGYNSCGQIGNGMSGDEECQLTPFKLNEFKSEKIEEISCGSNHSMVLTKSGRVYSWGSNNFGQLGICNTQNSQSPKIVELDQLVKKISCGHSHSLLLAVNGDIYVCGRNKSRISVNCNLDFFTTPTKLDYLDDSVRFKYIASHFEYDFSAAISENSILYIWGQCGQNAIIITKPQKTTFKSFNEAFEHYLQITYEPIVGRVIRFYDDFTENGKYEKEYIERRKVGEGSYGAVFEVIHKLKDYNYAIKLIKFKAEDKKEFLAELETSSIINDLRHENIAEYSGYWLENDFILKNGIKKYNQNFILYILMELCDQSLDKIIEEIEKDSNLYSNGSLTPLGYYISSEIFFDILKGVDYLHQQKPPIIHRDLKPENILMLKMEKSNDIRFKIADMGLATLHEFVLSSFPNISYSETLHTKGKGTLDYIAPEVEEAILDNDNSKARYDTKADIYSLGVIFKKLLHINIERVYNDNENGISLLDDKYETAKHLSIRMNSKEPIERPDCKELLEIKHLWAFTQEELNTLIDIDKEFKSYENYYIFVDRLQNRKFYTEYNVAKKIGVGHYGKLYEVCERYNFDSSKNKFAIKVLKIPAIHEKEFIKEIKLYNRVSEISHDNIVKYFNIWLENDFIFEDKVKIKIKNFLLHIQMELCHKTLAELIVQMENDSNIYSNKILTNLGYYMTSKIFIEILEGVNYLHTRNPPITHRYLNPNDIMLKIDYFGKSFVKITNPSLAAIYKYVKHSNIEEENHTSYLAIEVKNEENVDPRADVFSLGIILRELFFIDFKRVYVIQNERQPKHFEEIVDLCKKMTQLRADERPDNIQVILEENNLWALNTNKLNFNEEIEKALNSYNNSESFVYKLLKKILVNDNFIQNDEYRKELEKMNLRDSHRKVLDLSHSWRRFKENHRTPNNYAKTIRVRARERFENRKNEEQLEENLLNNGKQLLLDYPINEVVDRDLTSVSDMFVLHNYVKQWCCVSENDFYLNVVSNNNIKRMSFGPINEWAQRCSVTKDLTLVRNGLKPIRNCVNKFTVNQINENNEDIIGTECEIEFTNHKNFCGIFPISKNCKIIATNRCSKLIIMKLPYNQNNILIGIRPNDGFVLIHWRLSVLNTLKPLIEIQNDSNNCENIRNELKSFYNESENGHLFILGEGGHLLIVDKKSERCFLLVGFGGLDYFSL